MIFTITSLFIVALRFYENRLHSPNGHPYREMDVSRVPNIFNGDCGVESYEGDSQDHQLYRKCKDEWDDAIVPHMTKPYVVLFIEHRSNYTFLPPGECLQTVLFEHQTYRFNSSRVARCDSIAKFSRNDAETGCYVVSGPNVVHCNFDHYEISSGGYCVLNFSANSFLPRISLAIASRLMRSSITGNQYSFVEMKSEPRRAKSKSKKAAPSGAERRRRVSNPRVIADRISEYLTEKEKQEQLRRLEEQRKSDEKTVVMLPLCAARERYYAKIVTRPLPVPEEDDNRLIKYTPCSTTISDNLSRVRLSFPIKCGFSGCDPFRSVEKGKLYLEAFYEKQTIAENTRNYYRNKRMPCCCQRVKSNSEEKSPTFTDCC
uniref:Uncharacterized protein n=1 Tax=Romanomermis culicivorax TaxID=13658 RepID=A0A915K0A6_ROMCU